MNPLLSESLQQDPRVAQARQLLAAALADHQRALTGVRPADPLRKTSYEDLLQRFGEARAGTLFFPYLGSGIGRGPLVELADGSIKYDMIDGIGVHHFGHSHPTLLEAGIDAAIRDTVMQGNLQQNVESAALATELLGRAAPGTKLRHCFLTSSGAMANENALKLIFHKKPGRTRLLAFEHCFAGRTLALTQVTDKAAYRVGLPTVLNVDYVPFFDAAHPEESIFRARAVLHEHLARYPGQHAAMWAELVQGEGGFYPGTRDFFTALFDELRRAGVAIVLDEIQTFGRTSRLFAFQHFELEAYADVIAVGKMLQVCATLFTDEYKPAPGLISQTFTASTSAILAGQVILRELLREDLFGGQGRNLRTHERFARNLEDIGRRHAGRIAGPYGLGGMVAFTALGGREDVVKKLLRVLFDLGVIAFYCGQDPTRVRFLPPVAVLSDEDIDAVCRITEAALGAVV